MAPCRTWKNNATAFLGVKVRYCSASDNEITMQQHFQVLYFCPASFVTCRTHHIFGWLFLYAGDIFGTSFRVPTSVARITFFTCFFASGRPEQYRKVYRYAAHLTENASDTDIVPLQWTWILQITVRHGTDRTRSLPSPVPSSAGSSNRPFTVHYYPPACRKPIVFCVLFTNMGYP